VRCRPLLSSPVFSNNSPNSGTVSTSRGVVVNFDWGNGFRDLGPSARRRPLPLTGFGGITPGKFFEIFAAESRVWGQFGPENKLIEGQPDEYDVICRYASVLAFHLWQTIFAGARSAVPASKYLPERRSTARSRTTTLLGTREWATERR